MSNGARHGFGVFIGLLAIPALVAGVSYGYGEAVTQVLDKHTIPWQGDAATLASALLVALLVASRLSPLASLIPGLVIAVPPFIRGMVSLTWGGDQRLADQLHGPMRLGYVWGTAPGQLFMMVGAVLILASLFPSRWRARAEAFPGRHSADYDPADFNPAAVPPGGGPPALQFDRDIPGIKPLPPRPDEPDWFSS